MSIKICWLGYVCFEMVLPSGRVLVIDPYIDYSQTAPIKCQEAHNMAQEMAKHLAARSKDHFVDIVHGKWYEIGLKVSPV